MSFGLPDSCSHNFSILEGAASVGKLLEQDNLDLGYGAAKSLVEFTSNITSLLIYLKIVFS